MEWEQSTQDTETNEDEWEEHFLNRYRNIVQSCNLIDIHCGGTTEVVDAKNADNQQRTTTHEHQRKLHGGILLRPCSPYTDKEIHWYQGYLIEHKHGEKIGRNKETEHTNAQKNEPKEVFFLHRFKLP